MENIDSFTIFIYKYIGTYYTYTLTYPQQILRVPYIILYVPKYYNIHPLIYFTIGKNNKLSIMRLKETSRRA